MQKSNPYIWSGYRTQLGHFDCLKSVFSFHNETLNIWTHLIGFLIFLALLIRDIFLVIPALKPDNVAVSDIIVLVGVLLCYQERKNEIRFFYHFQERLTIYMLHGLISGCNSA